MKGFDQFVVRHKSDLQRIAKATRGEQQFDDVVQEAWLMARNLAVPDDVAADFLDPAFLKTLLSHLYQKLVRYTERNIRHATRLDHANNADAGESTAHPLMGKLVSDGGRDPLQYLQAIEDEPDSALYRQHAHSLAGAYVTLLNRLGHRMRAVAGHLLISLSYTYRCFARARWFAARQMPLALPMAETDFVLGPWRRTRASRVPMQLAFDFEDELPLGIARPDGLTAQEPVTGGPSGSSHAQHRST